jgi:hypothetical protein
MILKNLKLKLFYLKKVLLEYRAPFGYFFYRFIVAKKIFKSKKVFNESSKNKDLSIHILSCHRDLTMLLWSLASFYKYFSSSGDLYIHSDGTLENNDKFIINKIFPRAHIIEPKYFLKAHTYELIQYSTIYNFRTKYPEYFLLSKLIDPYFVSDKKIHLIIDSDLLWFKQPEEIEAEIESGAKNSLLMKGSGVGCPVYFKNGQKLDHHLSELNSGIVLYHKDNFSLDKLTEYLDRIDTKNAKNKHFIEQAGYATVLDNIKVLPQSSYIIKGNVNENTIVKHYTSPRRPMFYIEGLKNIAKKIL